MPPADDAVLFDLSDRGYVEVVGMDARTFLHNLSTNDVKKLTVGSSHEAFFATAQARAVAHVWIDCLPGPAGERFLLETAPGQGEPLRKHLDRFIISEVVEVADRTGSCTHFHLTGAGAPALVAQWDARTAGLAAGQVVVLEGGYVRGRLLLDLPGFDLFLPSESAEGVRRALLTAGATLGSPDEFEVCRIEAGTPRFGVDVDESRFVFEVGRNAQAISYTKGCYLGQEPVVMARDRGHINRTLLGLLLSGTGPAPARAKVLRGSEEVGWVTSSVESPRFGPIALAYVRRGHQEPGTAVDVATDAGPRTARVAALPFRDGCKPGHQE